MISSKTFPSSFPSGVLESRDKRTKKIEEFCKYLKEQGYNYEIEKMEVEAYEIYTTAIIGDTSNPESKLHVSRN